LVHVVYSSWFVFCYIYLWRYVAWFFCCCVFFFFSSRRRHTRSKRDWSSDVCSSDLAWWSFGGLFLVDSPEQRMMGIKDSKELAKQDWLGSADYDREDEDYWGKKWAEQYINFATYEKRDWLR